MTNNIIQTFPDQKNIPQKIADYYFDLKWTNEDGSLQLRYEGEENGYFTITLYNGGINIPASLEDPIIATEFENCVNAIFDMEAEKCYQNVNLLVNEPFVFENEKEPKFFSAVFNYDRCFENGECINEISILLLRSDNGFFNKLRFSVSSDTSDESLDKMKDFLIDWLKYVSIIGDTIN